MMNFQKYRAKRISHDGRNFSSKLEKAVFELLKLREKAKEIEIVKQQDHVYLTKADIHYIPDFKIFDYKLDDFVWVEAKGVELAPWRIKRRLWPFYGPGRLEVYKGSYNKITLHEVLDNKSDGDDAITCPACNHTFTGGTNDRFASDETVAESSANHDD